jgi:hypothetical protein
MPERSDHTPSAAQIRQLRKALRAEIKRRYEDAKLYPSEAQLDKAEAEALRRAES